MVRIKHRWVIGQLVFGDVGQVEEIASRDIVNMLREKLQQLFGDVGAGEFGGSTMIKFYDANTHIIVVRTAREAEQSVRLALAVMTGIKRNALIVRTLSVAGSSRTCLDKLRVLLDRALAAEAFLVPGDGHDDGGREENARQKRKDQYATLLQSLEL
jgi:RNase P/RNase MRP subunit POP5